MTAATPPSPILKGQDRPSGADPSQKGHIGWVAAGSVVAGVLAAILLAGAPFIPTTESGVTGAILVGLALGWAMVAVLSVRFTDKPQRWAGAPALFMGPGGFLLVVFGSPMQEALTWAWPPDLLVLVVVIEPGAGLMSSDLALMAPVVARDTRVCVYDRAGRGWSDSANTAQDAAQIATDLHYIASARERSGTVCAGGTFVWGPLCTHFRCPLS